MEEKKRCKRRIFTEEFKQEAVELVEKKGITKPAAELDIGSSVLREWRQKVKEPESQWLRHEPRVSLWEFLVRLHPLSNEDQD